MPHIICERLHGHWSAWFTDNPETAFGGEWPADAIERLVSTVPDLGAEKIVADYKQSTDTRLVFVIESGVCPDCGGTGEYVGLNAKEKCRTCGGSGILCYK